MENICVHIGLLVLNVYWKIIINLGNVVIMY